MARISANQLRWLAEAADGIRGSSAVMVERANGDIDVISEAKRTASDKVLVELETGLRGPGIDGSALVRVFVDGRTLDPAAGLTERVDALFVTQSAIQKFLLPYYMRFMSAAQVQALENRLFNDARVKAAVHIPPSSTGGFRVGCVCTEAGRDEPFVSFS
ncbi:MAG: hypothetical protein IT359_09000 [Gemmatimonadaceae bacterium]|nr:hypothetical protein [Gemmatimonadaceae bacterium]